MTRLCQKLGRVGHVEKVSRALELTRALLFKTSRGMERLGFGGKNERKLFQESRLSQIQKRKKKRRFFFFFVKDLFAKVLISVWSKLEEDKVKCRLFKIRAECRNEKVRRRCSGATVLLLLLLLSVVHSLLCVPFCF